MRHPPTPSPRVPTLPHRTSPRPGSHTLRVCTSTCTGGTTILFVGCVTRHEYVSHRAPNIPPRNTPEPMSHPVTNPWCVRGAGFHASSSHAVTTRPYPSASCVTSPRLTHPTGLSSTCTGGTTSLFVGCVTRPERFSHRAQITPPRNTPEPKPLPVTNPWNGRVALTDI
jgi:hypothetical protein